jgi:hypothetical protein
MLYYILVFQRKLFCHHDMMCPQVQWRRWPPDIEDTCEYFEETVVESLQGFVFQLGHWAGANNCLQ